MWLLGNIPVWQRGLSSKTSQHIIFEELLTIVKAGRTGSDEAHLLDIRAAFNFPPWSQGFQPNSAWIFLGLTADAAALFLNFSLT